jgi:hypothetical protein
MEYKYVCCKDSIPTFECPAVFEHQVLIKLTERCRLYSDMILYLFLSFTFHILFYQCNLVPHFLQ